MTESAHTSVASTDNSNVKKMHHSVIYEDLDKIRITKEDDELRSPTNQRKTSDKVSTLLLDGTQNTVSTANATEMLENSDSSNAQRRLNTFFRVSIFLLLLLLTTYIFGSVYLHDGTWITSFGQFFILESS